MINPPLFMANSSETVDLATGSVIDMSNLQKNSVNRSSIVEDIGRACQQMGYFHVVNHGISDLIIEDAIQSAMGFFNLPSKEKNEYMSSNIENPVTYVVNSRELLKHYSHPLEDYIELWPHNPPNYREKMAKYVKEVRTLAMNLLAAIMESLGLPPTYMHDKFEEGIQIMAVNCYSPWGPIGCTSSIREHTDHSIITILLQSTPGLQAMNYDDGKWREVPKLHGAFEVIVGDLLKVLSNGLYKSAMHRVIECTSETRISIASFHNLAMDEMIKPAEELVDEEHPKRYKENCLRDFLNFVASKKEAKMFLESLKL